ncbi:MAG: NAD-dependent epimerase/dehydratase family protein [Chloroflexota bacterium]|nr:MAG: NAD-dependent epimerase/dehydratase family protein [Chloroflexota bacterium]
MAKVNDRVVVLGAGPLGTALAGQLAAQGKDARLLSVMNNRAYDMPGTKPEAIDGANEDQVRQAVAGASTVYLCLNAHYVDWYALYPPRLQAAMSAAAAASAKLVYHDSIYNYGPVDGPLTEDLPNSDKTRKGKLRGEMADKLLEAAGSGQLQAVIGRSADMYGPGALNSSFNSTLGQRHFYPALAGRAVSVLGDIDAPHTYAFVDDVARGLITLAEREEALGQVWHIPAAPTLSHRQLMTIAYEEAGQEPKIRGSRVSTYFVKVIGRFQADVGEVAEMSYQFDKPLTVDHGKFEAAFGSYPTPHQEAIGRTLVWYRANPLPA